MPSSNLKSENEQIAEKQEGKGFLFRTTIMYSATMPTAVERIARTYLRRAVYIMIGDAGKAVDRIEQKIIWTSEGKKQQLLLHLIANGLEPPIIVFVNIKRNCDTVAKCLTNDGYHCTVLHSGKTQDQRENAINGFREGRFDILVATDVAGRGIDIPGVNHVINYDLPKDIEPYTHRIGRTGRAGKTGVATSFMTNEDTEIMYDLKEMLAATGNVVPPELSNHESSKVKPGTFVAKRRRDTIIFAR
jgi:ATP-dependent RNA helicase DDX23/PRP28